MDLVFAPGVDEVYPPGFETTVSVGRLATVLEGAARPGHFDGVATVVTILFNLVGADVAYFGQKDAQQVMVISRMARDLAIGDARSSPARRSGSLTVSRSPHATRCSHRMRAPPRRSSTGRSSPASSGTQGGERSADVLRDTMWEVLSSEPLAIPEYVSVASLDPRRELEEVDEVVGPALLSTAVRFGEIRLIDNERIGE